MTLRSRPGLVSLRSRHDFEVATRKGRRDLAGLAIEDLASRPRFLGHDKGVL